MKTSRIIMLISLIVAIVTSSFAVEARAANFIFPLDYEISSGSDPQGTAPWITASFIDVSPNTVQLSMSANNLVGTEFIKSWLFNSSIDPTSLTFTPIDISAISAPTINTGGQYKADGDGYYDIEFNFQTSDSPMSGRFGAGDTVIYNISGPSLSASAFNLISAQNGGNGEYHTAAKVQGINGSGWIANTTVVPEPISTILFITGGTLLAGRRFLKKKI